MKNAKVSDNHEIRVIKDEKHKKSFELTEDDLIRLKSFCKSKEFNKVIEKFNESCQKL